MNRIALMLLGGWLLMTASGCVTLPGLWNYNTSTDRDTLPVSPPRIVLPDEITEENAARKASDLDKELEYAANQDR